MTNKELAKQLEKTVEAIEQLAMVFIKHNIDVTPAEQARIMYATLQIKKALKDGK